MIRWRLLIALTCACVLSACQTMPSVSRPRDAESPRGTPAAQPAPRQTTAEMPSGDDDARKTAIASYLHPEPETPTTGAELFDRLTQRFADPLCPDDPVVKRWMGIYARSPTRFAAQLEPILPFMSLALEEAERYRLPGELVLLPIVESWYRTDAGAGTGYVGLWQFGAPTARGLGLPVRSDYDARMAAFSATDAAFRHLADMHNGFGDWKLASMGFNAGEYRLRKVLEKTPNTRISPQHRLPSGLSTTTYEHLAKVQALACLIGRPEQADITLPRETRFSPLTTITLPDGASTLTAIATATGLDGALLRRLNPSFRRGIVSAQADRELLVPYADAARFENFALPIVATAPNAQTQADGIHTVRKGDTLGAIAQRYRVRLRDLLAWNGLGMRSVLRPGQRIRLEP